VSQLAHAEVKWPAASSARVRAFETVKFPAPGRLALVQAAQVSVSKREREIDYKAGHASLAPGGCSPRLL
jgi:hypothetical protein